MLTEYEETVHRSCC